MTTKLSMNQKKIFVAVIFLFFSSLHAQENKIVEPLPDTRTESISHEGVATPQYLLLRGLDLYNQQQWAQSKKHLQIYIDKFGDNEVANRYLAQVLIIEGDLEKARGYLLRGLKSSPQATETLLLLASIAENLRDTDGAIDYYEKVLDIDPYNEEAIFALSQLYLQDKKDEYHAMGLYKRLVVALQHNGGSSYQLIQIYNALGRYYTEKGDYHHAIGYFLKIEKLDARHVPTLFAVGQLYKLSGNFEKSIEYMQKIQKLDFRNTFSLFSLAESYYILRSPQEQAYVEAYLRRAGKLPEKLIVAMNDELLERNKEALEKFSRMKEIAARVGKSKIYEKENDEKNLKLEAYHVVLMSQQIQAHALAREYSQIVFSLLEKEKQAQNFDTRFFVGSGQALDMPVIKNAIDSIELYSLYAQILENLNESRAAIVYFQQSSRYVTRLEQILQKSPDFLKEEKNLDIQESLELLKEKKYQNATHTALLYGNLDSYPQAYLLFRRASAIYPQRSRTYFLHGLTVFKEANQKKNKTLYQQSYNLINQALSLASAEKAIPASYYFYRGVLTEKQHGFTKAEPDLKKAIELDGNNPSYLNFLGYMYSQNNKDLPKARSLLIRALDDDLENHAYLDSLGWIFYKQGEYNHALRNLLLAEHYAEKSNIKDAVVYFHLAETYNKLKNSPMANLNYKRALEFIADSSEDLDVLYIRSMIKKTMEKENEK